MTLTYNFQGQISNWLYLGQKWSECHETKSKYIDWALGFKYETKKQIHRLSSRLQMWPSALTLAMTLTLNFQGQISNWLYHCQKWCDCHEMKSKHINWYQDLRCDHRVRLWPWPWPWIFKVKYGIGYISVKNGPIPTKWKANTSIWTLGLKCDNGFDLGHDHAIWIFKVICDLDHLVTKVRCKDLPDSDRGDFRCQRAVDSSSLWYYYYVIRNY